VLAVLAFVIAAAGIATYMATQASARPGGRTGTPTAAATGASSTPHLTPSPSPPPHPSGSLGDYAVAEHRYTFTEHAGPALGVRALNVTVHYPDPGQPQQTGAPGTSEFPLIVFAPGYRQCSASYSDLLRQWASAGYVVAAVNFPRTNCHDVYPNEADLVNQPADLTFVIRQLQQMSSLPGGPLSGVISTTKVAVAGHSDGGDTVAALTAMSCCRYPGLRAAVVLAGAEWPAFAGHWFSGPTAPMLFVQGTADTINPPAASLQLYQADRTGIRYYLQLDGADHLTPYEGVGAPEPIVARTTIAFFDYYLAGDGATIAAIRRSGDVAGVSELVTGGRLP
jgi:pimeloyl-ACP methyl ester carboxylesterase